MESSSTTMSKGSVAVPWHAVLHGLSEPEDARTGHRVQRIYGRPRAKTCCPRLAIHPSRETQRPGVPADYSLLERSLYPGGTSVLNNVSSVSTLNSKSRRIQVESDMRGRVLVWEISIRTGSFVSGSTQ